MTDDVSLLPQLIVQAGPMQGASFRLHRDTCLIGRDDGVDVLVEDFRVSRRHALIERTGGRLVLADAGSTNGTWLNDRQLTEAAELRDGDRIRLGSVELRFYDPATASTEPVGTAIHAISGPRSTPGTAADAGRPPTAALFGPTQLMNTSRRGGGAWLVLAVSVLALVVAGAVWVLLMR
ncbi:MAG TPA: FHA domain-containing protein [Micromonosporaceae bacterium]|nr:FHA domain-containing protein [Micromonosporaceae bacterium]